jgi:2-polyprenyl-3-methyl-5-hydroxy-6-metoxy-1,4-benzoquinol methylase
VLQKTEYRLDCPACGRMTPQRYLYSKNHCDIRACEECGLGRTEAQQFDPAAYYTGDYFSGGHPDGYGDYVGAEPILRREFARTVEFIRRFRADGRLLELGCAYGFFLHEAKPYFDVTGIELAEAAAAHARNTGLNVFTGLADAATLERLGAMDVVVLLDVIEHLPNPRETLQLSAQHLVPGGIIVLTTGDFASLYARIAGPRWRLMTPPQHLWFFTPASMGRLATTLGLALTSLDHPWKFVPLSLVSFQVRRMLGLPPRAGRGRLGLPINLFDAMRVVLRKPT